MHDPRTFWLTVTNIALGVAVVVLVVGIATGTLCEIVAKWRKRSSLDAELDRNMHRLFDASRGRK
jgi:uncharacterized membrane-anchored protein YhcB (DUF1043 family)